MNKYEIMYIVNVDLDEEANEALHNQVTRLIEDNATIDERDHLGVKRFAYEIKHQNEGDYMVVKFTAEPEAADHINRELNIIEGLVRYMIFATEE